MNDRIDFLTPPEEYARIAEEQRAFIKAVADKIERGEALTSTMEQQFAAGILRAWAKQIPDTEPRAPGKAPVVDAGALALGYALLVNAYGMKPSRAKAQLAEEHKCSIEYVGRALKKYGDAALRTIPRNPNLKRK